MMWKLAIEGSRDSQWSVVVHGGAGDISEDRKARHAEGCRRAIAAARAGLSQGGSAMEAVEVAVRALEDDPVFNAGTGACLNEQGEVEHDAAIMDGATLAAGGVCALRGFLAPIAIARQLLEEGRHVLLASEGARQFALRMGHAEIDPALLVTEAARAAFEKVRHGNGPVAWAGGTVGAVAKDKHGHVAAATSTGGMINKALGRVGDSPIVGSGTYADDRAGAVSATGAGEGIMRIGLANRILFAMERGDVNGAEAAGRGLQLLFDRLACRAGVIAVAPDGGLGLARSTETMSYAAAWSASPEGVSGT